MLVQSVPEGAPHAKANAGQLEGSSLSLCRAVPSVYACSLPGMGFILPSFDGETKSPKWHYFQEHGHIYIKHTLCGAMTFRHCSCKLQTPSGRSCPGTISLTCCLVMVLPNHLQYKCGCQMSSILRFAQALGTHKVQTCLGEVFPSPKCVSSTGRLVSLNVEWRDMVNTQGGKGKCC